MAKGKHRARRSEPPRTRRRSPILIALALLLCAGLGFWLWRREPELPPPRPAPRAEAPAPVGEFPGRYTPPNPKVKGRTKFPDTPESKKEFNRRKAEMTEAALKSVNDWIKYPLWSSPLTDNMQYKPPVAVHNVARGPADSLPSLEVWMEQLHYRPRETVRVYAVCEDKNGLTHPESLRANTMGAIRPRPELPLDFVDRGDGTLVAVLDIPEDVARRNRGEWGVSIDAYIGGEHRHPHLSFYMMATDATVTGPYRVAVEDGSLAVYVGITATAASRQHLKGELWGPKDEPISYAWVRDDNVHVGLNTMKLVFYGKAIRDSGINGPYRIKNLLLTTFEDNNDRLENPAVDPGLTTEAYAHTVFTDVPINGNNETLLDKKKILTEELDQARAGLYDPNDPIPPRSTTARKDVPPPQ